MWRVSDIYVARFRHGRGVLSAHKRNTIEWEVNANHRCLSPTFVFLCGVKEVHISDNMRESLHAIYVWSFGID